MKTLKILKDKKFVENNCRVREAVRAVLFDQDNLVPILFVSKQNYHKLPGGGIESGEDKMQALTREVLEETGCAIKVAEEIGKIIEYRSAINFAWHTDLKQTSYCYLGKIINKNNLPSFDQGELAEGFKLKWLDLTEAIQTIKNDQPKNYEGSFIQARDLAFLEKAMTMKKNNL